LQPCGPAPGTGHGRGASLCLDDRPRIAPANGQGAARYRSEGAGHRNTAPQAAHRGEGVRAVSRRWRAIRGHRAADCRQRSGRGAAHRPLCRA
nr:hypothetical protein [Tanacetum cinerariifolium]